MYLFKILDRDGNVISNYNLMDDFRPLILPGSSDTYYVFDTVGGVDNYTGLNYLDGQTINIVYRETNREFSANESINLIPSIKDSSIPIEKLENNVQALIKADHSLTDEQETILDGFITTGIATVWTAGDLYVKDNDASSANDLSHYVNVGQGNGILAGF